MGEKSMRCPICNCKMKHKTICPYCKITGEQVSGASNQLAKIAIRNGKKENVVYSSTIPYDINYTRLLLIAIFTGFLGVHNYYVGRYIKGAFCTLSVIFCVIFATIEYAFGATRYFVFDLFYEIFFLIATVTILLWIYDIMNLSFKKFKMPVIIQEPEKSKVNIETRKNYAKKGKN